MKTFRVKEVAQAAGITVRTLHHYDSIALLVPSGRSEAGYRFYSRDDVLRLQQILLYRELGMSLEAIRRLLDDPEFDRRTALLSQRAAIEGRQRRNADMLRSIDRALETLDTEKEIEMNTLFDGFDPSAHEAEAKERWGETDLYKEAARRAKGYGEAEHKAIKAELDGIMKDLADARAAGRSAADEAVQAIVERHRLHIDRWFYPCSREMHQNLAGLYETDERFAANIDRVSEGLTEFFVAAIRGVA